MVTQVGTGTGVRARAPLAGAPGLPIR